ncbi:ABC transporter permease [Anoxybacter fermentans]|uniref:ABC transporter permease n=1 Tax=Anoxybacter fermentans TaxID=1323375 RepID=A0A3Q9HNP8_9FIRM|nr:FtsX-like permease family protein [Anoxybacter fermentans]AZR72176.1 ABC transporter permease [Anoxybacter fermentans]
MFLIKLALRNITRHKRRTLLTAVVIAFGIFIYILSDSLLLGMEERGFNNIIDMETGHLQVSDQNYWKERDQMPLDNLVEFNTKLAAVLKKTPHFKALAPRLKFKANLNNGFDELPIMVIGIEPEKERQVFTTEEYLVEGSMLTKGKYEAVIGKSLAELMELQVGDYLTLVFKNKDGVFNTIDAVITGLLHTSHPTINNNVVYVPLDIAQQALNLENEVSEIVIRLKDRIYTEDAVSELSSRLAGLNPGLKAYSWQQSAKSLIAMVKAENVENQVVISIFLIIAAVGIINTVILAALERLKEIGMMKAMGMREREIIFVFMMEAVAIGIIGGIIGCILGAIGVLILNIYGLDLAWFGGEEITYGLPILGRFYGVWNPSIFVFMFSFGVIVALIASILPARWAARKDPVKAIYHR